jgi:hypothetical protein
MVLSFGYLVLRQVLQLIVLGSRGEGAKGAVAGSRANWWAWVAGGGQFRVVDLDQGRGGCRVATNRATWTQLLSAQAKGILACDFLRVDTIWLTGL